MVTGKVETRRPQPRKYLEGSYRMELHNLFMKTLEKDWEVNWNGTDIGLYMDMLTSYSSTSHSPHRMP